MEKKKKKNKNQQPNIDKVLYEIIEEINTLLLLLTERTVILCLLYLSFHAQEHIVNASSKGRETKGKKNKKMTKKKIKLNVMTYE